MCLHQLSAILYGGYKRTNPDTLKVKRDFSQRAKALDARINKLHALKDGKLSKAKAQNEKRHLRVKTRADVISELDRLKTV